MKFTGEKVPRYVRSREATRHSKREAKRGRRRQEKLFCKGKTEVIFPRHIRGWAD
jgi:hypothetical protein